MYRRILTEEEQLQEIRAYRKQGLSPHRLSNEYLYMPFSVKVHSQVFTCYCEVIIWPDGKVEYAIPSHSEKLYQEYCKKHNLNRDQLWEQFKGREFAATDLMMEDLGIIFIWYDHMMNVTKVTQKQLDVIGELIKYDCVDVKLFDGLRVY